ncbi:MAG: hypothetical protein NTZ79_15135, partial [Proteobacteria bacterium]|nr:hypothetical protein [Pseudomonadota bacterium]
STSGGLRERCPGSEWAGVCPNRATAVHGGARWAGLEREIAAAAVTAPPPSAAAAQPLAGA